MKDFLKGIYVGAVTVLVVLNIIEYRNSVKITKLLKNAR